MKFVHFDHPGGPEVLQIKVGEVPQPQSGEVLIQVEAAGVNRPDILQRKGAYPPPPGASSLLGLEIAGKIVQCGPESHPWKIGDRVCALVAGGGYAEYCVAPAAQCLPVPQGISMVEAAGIPETFFTVWENVFRRGRLKAGESILIHGGSSGIGTTAIQLAKAFQASVFVTAGTEEKCRVCCELGAIAAVNYRMHDFLSEIRRINLGQGMDLILDMVAGDYFQKNLDLLAQNGRLVQIAVQKGEQVNLSLKTLMAKGATITGSTLRPRSIDQKGAIGLELKNSVWPLIESKKVRVILDRTYPLDQVAEAHRRMEKSEHVGKIVLKIS